MKASAGLSVTVLSASGSARLVEGCRQEQPAAIFDPTNGVAGGDAAGEDAEGKEDQQALAAASANPTGEGGERDPARALQRPGDDETGAESPVEGDACADHRRQLRPEAEH